MATFGEQDGRGTGEWPALYAQYLLRAASRSTRSTELYQRVFDCLARGELAPTVFRDMTPAFIQTRGPAYSGELAQLTSRFFTAIVELNATASHDLSRAVLSEGAQDGPPAPPQLDATNPVLWYQQLTAYAGELNSRALASFRTLMGRVAAGELAPDKVLEASTEYVERRLPDQLAKLGELYFGLLTDLSELRSEYEEDLLERVLASAKRPGQDSPPALDFAVEPEGTASTSLLLTNTRPVAAVVHCAVTEVRRSDGIGPAFPPKMTVAPDGLQIPPHGEAALTLTLRAAEGEYEPGVTYVGAVRIERESEPRLDIPLRITAVSPAPAATRPQRRATTTRKTSKRKSIKRKS